MAKATKAKWSNEEVVDLIKKEKSAQEIMDATGITRPTLQKKVLEVSINDKKFYNIQGIVSETKLPYVTKLGNITIPKTCLSGFNISQGDEFTIKLEANTITLTKKTKKK